MHLCTVPTFGIFVLKCWQKRSLDCDSNAEMPATETVAVYDDNFVRGGVHIINSTKGVEFTPLNVFLKIIRLSNIFFERTTY